MSSKKTRSALTQSFLLIFMMGFSLCFEFLRDKKALDTIGIERARLLFISSSGTRRSPRLYLQPVDLICFLLLPLLLTKFNRKQVFVSLPTPPRCRFRRITRHVTIFFQLLARLLLRGRFELELVSARLRLWRLFVCAKVLRSHLHEGRRRSRFASIVLGFASLKEISKDDEGGGGERRTSPAINAERSSVL
jgi:hypothetical protein